ncbi:MAG: hypothetical protein V3T42_06925, partial [Nitrospirales bacterium]
SQPFGGLSLFHPKRKEVGGVKDLKSLIGASINSLLIYVISNGTRSIRSSKKTSADNFLLPFLIKEKVP